MIELIPWQLLFIMIFALVFVFLFSGIPVAISLAAVGIVFAFVFLGRGGPIAYAAWDICTKFVLVAIPLFIFMGKLLLYSGMSEKLYTGATALLGKVPGSLLHANIASCAVFAAISGSSVATAATIGTVAIPELKRRGYEHRLVLGSLAAGGTLGILIPPSISMIVYGAITGVSIGKLFIGGVVPGIMLALLFMGYIMVRVIIRPQMAPPYETMPLKWKVLQIIRAWPVAVIMFGVLGGIYLGVTTPTEAAALGSIFALVFGLAYRRLNWSILRECLRSTAKTTSMVMFVIVGAWLLAAILAVFRLPDYMVAWVAGLAVPRLAILLLVFGVYIFLGCFLSGVEMMLLTLPIIFPIITGLGYDPIWFGIAMVILIETSLLTPPVGMNVYVIHGISPENSLTEVFISIIPFFFIILVGLAIVTVFPVIATWLPGTMMPLGG